MSDNSPLLDLEQMLLPAWAKEAPSTSRFEHFTGEEEVRPRRGGPARRRDQGDRPARDQEKPGRPPAQAGRPPAGRDRRPGPRGPQRDEERRRQDRERENAIPLPSVNVTIGLEDKNAESLARQIRITGRAYPLVDIALMILQKTDRFQITFSVAKDKEGHILQPLYRCALDETLWTDKDEAADYLLERHFDLFYQAERTPTDPPKGVYTFVAVCDLNGAVLGPPNYHGYQEQLRRLYNERYSRMPFEAFKSKIRIVRDEAVVKKWIEDQSWKTEYLCLNVPEAPRLANYESVVQHFRDTHLPVQLQEVESHTLSGTAALKLPCHGLRRLAMRLVTRQRHFPLDLIHALSAQFSARGLQFFKRDKNVTHVSVARPHYLDLETSVVSDSVKRIIQFINDNPGCTRQKLQEALAPSPAPTAPAKATGAEEGVMADNQTASAPPPTAPEPTPEQVALISDLHWLVHQGHVIELANGVLETAKKPNPKPPKPAPAQPAASSEATTEAITAPAEASAPTGQPPAAAPMPEASQAVSPAPESAPSPASGQGEEAPSTSPAPPPNAPA